MKAKDQLMLLFLDFITFFADIVSDIIVIYGHSSDGDDWWFTLALVFFILSFLLVPIAVIVQSIQKHREENKTMSHGTWLFLIFGFPFLPVLRYAQMFYRLYQTYFKNSPNS